MLIKCPECGKEISDKAKSCPNCGFPIEGIKEKPVENKKEKETIKKEEKIISNSNKKDRNIFNFNGRSFALLVFILIVVIFMMSACFSDTSTTDSSSESDSAYTGSTSKQSSVLVPMGNDLTIESVQKDMKRASESVVDGEVETSGDSTSSYFSCYELNLIPNLTTSYADFTIISDSEGNVRSSIVRYDISEEEDVKKITDFYNSHATYLDNEDFALEEEMDNFELFGTWEYGEFTVYHFKYDDMNGNPLYAICYIG